VGLEQRDPRSGRWVLYETQEQHTSDCASYPFDQIPGRVFLDTNIVNLLVKYAHCIFEQEPFPAALPATTARDVEALLNVFSGRGSGQLGHRCVVEDVGRDRPNAE